MQWVVLNTGLHSEGELGLGNSIYKLSSYVVLWGYDKELGTLILCPPPRSTGMGEMYIITWRASPRDPLMWIQRGNSM